MLGLAAAAVGKKARARADREGQKKLKNVERKIARLDEEKRAVHERLLSVTDAAEAQRLHSQLTDLTGELTLLEEQWLIDRFGDSYREYRRNVPRWVPRLTPWEPERQLTGTEGGQP